MNTESYACALTIAGSDSGGGAGIQADLKTFHSLGVYGASALTALTAQNTCAVRSIFSITPQFLEEQIRAVLDDIAIDAVKTGMLESTDNIQTTARLIKEYNLKSVVVDPVMVAKSGDRLLKDDAMRSIINDLLPCAAIVTPNIPEAEAIINHGIKDLDGMKFAAQAIIMMGAGGALIKGGHTGGDTSIDVFFDGDEFIFLESKRLDQTHTHGTGCTLSAAIAAHLALGFNPKIAVEKSKHYITEAIKHAKPLGKGIGPVNHFWNRKI